MRGRIARGRPFRGRPSRVRVWPNRERDGRCALVVARGLRCALGGLGPLGPMHTRCTARRLIISGRSTVAHFDECLWHTWRGGLRHRKQSTPAARTLVDSCGRPKTEETSGVLRSASVFWAARMARQETTESVSSNLPLKSDLYVSDLRKLQCSWALPCTRM